MFNIFKTGFFGYENFKKVTKEFYYTFSNEKTFLSSKRIERALLLTAGLWLTIWFVRHNIDRLSATDFLIIVSPIFGYAGFNTVMHAKDKKTEDKADLSNKTENNIRDENK